MANTNRNTKIKFRSIDVIITETLFLKNNIQCHKARATQFVITQFIYLHYLHSMDENTYGKASYHLTYVYKPLLDTYVTFFFCYVNFIGIQSLLLHIFGKFLIFSRTLCGTLTTFLKKKNCIKERQKYVIPHLQCIKRPA